MVPCMLRGEPNWKELKAHGAGWWVKSSDTLKRLIEKVFVFASTLHHIKLHYILSHYITLHYVTLHCITLHCIALHCIALHYIT